MDTIKIVMDEKIVIVKQYVKILNNIIHCHFFPLLSLLLYFYNIHWIYKLNYLPLCLKLNSMMNLNI